MFSSNFFNLLTLWFNGKLDSHGVYLKFIGFTQNLLKKEFTHKLIHKR